MTSDKILPYTSTNGENLDTNIPTALMPPTLQEVQEGSRNDVDLAEDVKQLSHLLPGRDDSLVESSPKYETSLELWLFPSAAQERDIRQGRINLPLTTLRELKMMEIMNQITDQPKWYDEVLDVKVAENWVEEIIEIEGSAVSRKVADWIIEELRYKAEVFKATGIVSVYNGDVVKSDAVLTDEIRAQLCEFIRPLEDVPSREKDWRPGSGERVVDLVNPSLYSLQPGRTWAQLDNVTDHTRKRLPVTDHTLKRQPMASIQWHPCRINISGKNPKIASHISNLNPDEHRPLYGLIEQVIDAAIPLWNSSLAPLMVTSDRRTRLRLTYKGTQSKQINQPEPAAFSPPDDIPPFDLRENFKSEGLEVIVKMTNIELTPGKPSYFGELWHVEGNSFDNICATAHYYYSSENISESRIAFRQRLNISDIAKIEHPVDFYSWLPEIFGCNVLDRAVQDVGNIDTLEGRIITYPNILQNQHRPFRLKDITKPGHLKILTLFLVDPKKRAYYSLKVQKPGDVDSSSSSALIEELVVSEQRNVVSNSDEEGGIPDDRSTYATNIEIPMEEIKFRRKGHLNARRNEDVCLEDLFESGRFTQTEANNSTAPLPIYKELPDNE